MSRPVVIYRVVGSDRWRTFLGLDRESFDECAAALRRQYQGSAREVADIRERGHEDAPGPLSDTAPGR